MNKVVSAMTFAQSPYGGQEATILSLYTTMYHWGAIVAALFDETGKMKDEGTVQFLQSFVNAFVDLIKRYQA